MEFSQIYELLTESVLGDKDINGSKHIIQVKLIKHNEQEDQIRVEIKSLRDPALKGFIEYDIKHEGILAYQALNDQEAVIEYMDRHKNNPTAFDWKLIVSDELDAINVQNATDNPEDAELDAGDTRSDGLGSLGGGLGGPNDFGGEELDMGDIEDIETDDTGAEFGGDDELDTDLDIGEEPVEDGEPTED